MKRGFVLSLDALVAITILLILAIFLAAMSFSFYSPELEYERLYYAGKDMLAVMQEAKVSSLSDFDSIQYYESIGVITEDDMNKTLLEVIGSLWVSQNATLQDYARNITQDVMQTLLPSKFGHEIVMDNSTIYKNGTIQQNSFLSRFSTIVSGFQTGKPVSGYVASAYMTRIRKTTSSYIYFGGYVGDGNITRIVMLPDDADVFNVYMEFDAGNNFTLYVNGNYSGHYVPTEGNLTASNWTVCDSNITCANFTSGTNVITLNFTDSSENNYIGGGFIRLDYNTSKAYTLLINITNNTATQRYYFPGIHGLINIFSSIYVPGSLKNMTMFLHYKNNITVNNTGVPVFVNLGGERIYSSSELGDINITLNNTYLSQILNYTRLSNKTIPLRFGTESFLIRAGVGTSDTILITDVSGSMDTCDVNSECSAGICDTSEPCHRERINVAKDTDKQFVDTVLNVTGNRVGIVAYRNTIVEDWTKDLTQDKDMLDNTIDQYGPSGSTCICCGINRAADMLTASPYKDVVIPEKSEWFYNTSYPSSEPPLDINGSDWKNESYNDSTWSNGTAILGFENTPYSPNVDTDIGNNGGNYYFRKHFTLSRVNEIEFGDLYVLSDNRVEVYLNGHLVYNDTSNSTARYWNNLKIIFSDNFEDYYDSGANRLYSTEINRSPGYWIVDGTPSQDKEIFLMANYPWYPAHSGTDVLVFRDMDAYGYAETTLNLSGYTNPVLSYWWREGPNNMESYEYGDVRVWDGEWHRIAAYRYGDVYHYVEKGLSEYNLNSEFKIRFGSRSSWDYERFYIDDVVVRENSTRINTSYLKNGDNVIAVKLYNNDSDSAKFDLKFEVQRRRYKSMLVMSDGQANVQCPLQGTGSSIQDAIQAACDARDKGIDVYSVAFGSDADEDTLKKIACWNCSANDWMEGESADHCSRYFHSSDADELEEIYRNIANKVANATYEAQIINVSGNIELDNILYPDSYIEYNYTPVQRLDYGEISVNIESPPFGGDITSPKNVTIFLLNEKIIDAKVTSYSSQFWTDNVSVNTSKTGWTWRNVFNLSEYGTTYYDLGDPFIVHIPVDLISPGENNSISIDTGAGPDYRTGGSPDDRFIYTVSTKASVGYGEVFDTMENATQDAIERLKEYMARLNVTVLDSDIVSQNIGNVPSLWGPAVMEIRVWA